MNTVNMQEINLFEINFEIEFEFVLEKTSMPLTSIRNGYISNQQVAPPSLHSHSESLESGWLNPPRSTGIRPPPLY